MPTKSQSPGPNPTTSQAKSGGSRKVANPLDQTSAGRAGSAGGIVLSKEQDGHKMSSTVTPKAATPPLAKDTTAASTGPNRQRRRPRKLNKEPTSQPTASNSTSPSTPASASAAAAVNDVLSPVSTTELEALKSRVRGLEAKVEELYNSNPDPRSARSPRRRGKGRKGSSQTQVPTTSSIAEPAKVEDEEADEELVRLEDELEVARRDLELYRPRTGAKAKRSTSEETDYIEEIPRDGAGAEDTASTVDRQVTLTGNYRIPLPASVSMTDVKKIQGGVSAAQNVAKSFLEQRRAQQAVQNPGKPQTPKPKGKQPSTSTALSTETGGGQSWGEWFGGYSVAISKAVKNIEAEAAIESQNAGAPRRPDQAGRTKSTPSTKTTAKPATRPKQRAGNASSEKVQGLVS